ncbi:MAG: DUF6168 family protein [Flavobacteriaceae bacterium]|jgi:hypothetical protein|nr:DUF6168 family protein [Flavobacteriaceae bacterium]MDG2499078.1 DUF6168 family protein [Flavobacteriaceae bacterium]
MLKHPIVSFSSRLILLVSLVFGLHLFLLQSKGLPLFENKILASYIINTFLTIGIVFLLFKLKEKYTNQIGFLFLGSSFIKFLTFFVVFYGAYKADGSIKTLEFLAFFIPYSLCLILETTYLSKWLNEM